MPKSDYLFAEADWYSVEQHQKETMAKDIQEMDGNRLLNTAPEDLVRYFADKYRIDVPTLIDESISADQREVQIDVSRDPMRFIRDRSRPFHIAGTAVEIHVSFAGEAAVFQIRPTTFSLNPPRARVANNVLVLTVEGLDLSPDQVRGEINRTLAQIRESLEHLRASAATLNNELPPLARNAIEVRRKKLLSDQHLAASLGFPMRERADSPRTFVAPEVRRRIAPVLPPATTTPFKPEPALLDADYEHILRVIQNMAHVMERSPSAFSTIDEEALRSHFLVQLNGHFEGQATGETFNYQGKTDILIRSGDRNIFIAECKYWGGPKKLTDTIDQLLGYSSWRDTKVAVILFNRNRDFSRVLEAITGQVRTHPNFKRDLGKISETVFRYVFAHKDDANRELFLTVLAFDVPV